jgi:thiosulfate dehydrogenase [quinone] large subunit
MLLGLLAAVGAGRFLGIDRWLERWSFVERHPRLKYLLG